MHHKMMMMIIAIITIIIIIAISNTATMALTIATCHARIRILHIRARDILAQVVCWACVASSSLGVALRAGTGPDSRPPGRVSRPPPASRRDGDDGTTPSPKWLLSAPHRGEPRYLNQSAAAPSKRRYTSLGRDVGDALRVPWLATAATWCCRCCCARAAAAAAPPTTNDGAVAAAALCAAAAAAPPTIITNIITTTNGGGGAAAALCAAAATAPPFCYYTTISIITITTICQARENKSVGETVCFAWQGMIGTFVCSLVAWLMFQISPGGACEKE